MILRNELDRARFIKRLNTSPIKDPAGHYLEVRVQRAKPRRSIPQNSTLHAWIHLLAIHAGCTDQDMKDDLKRELLPVTERADAITGEVREVLASTSKLSKPAFAEFMARIEVLAVQHFGVKLPQPNDPQGREFILELLAEAA